MIVLVYCTNLSSVQAQIRHDRHNRGGFHHAEKANFPKLHSESGVPLTKIFSEESIEFEDITLPYRKAVVGTVSESSRGALVLYLHGGSRKGEDNTRQLTEIGLRDIYNYLVKNGISATVLAPQCPSHLSWDRRVNEALKAMIDANLSTVDTSRIYAFGGSMGGVGVWSLLSTYSGLFAAAMPVASDPMRVDLKSALSTSIYSVVGREDMRRDIAFTENFVATFKEAGGTIVFDIEEEWDHATTCQKSYTDARLAWIFASFID